MPRLDSVINENVAVLMEDGAFALFILFHPGGIWQLKSPRPREIAIYPRQKKLMSGDIGPWGLGAAGID